MATKLDLYVFLGCWVAFLVIEVVIPKLKGGR